MEKHLARKVEKGFVMACPVRTVTRVAGVLAVSLALHSHGGICQQRGLSTTPPKLKPVATMSEHRAGHTATRLSDGRILIAGGFTEGLNGSSQVYFRSAELFDPKTKKLSRTGDMTYSRAGHSATVMHNGLVLVAGGFADMGTLSSAELFDPVTETFTPIGNMNSRRGGFTSTPLLDGRILFCGGGDREATSSAELFDPATKRFALTGSMTVPRSAHTATRLPGGMVLVVGGSSRRNIVLLSAEIYNPASGTFAEAGSMRGPRYKHAAVALADGDVLVIGGADDRDWRGKLAIVERYGVATGRFTRLSDLQRERFKFSDALVGLDDGTFLIAGGSAVIERYAASGEESSIVATLDNPYYSSTATLLKDGSVMIAGGYDDRQRVTDRVWIWRR